MEKSKRLQMIVKPQNGYEGRERKTLSQDAKVAKTDYLSGATNANKSMTMSFIALKIATRSIVLNAYKGTMERRYAHFCSWLTPEGIRH